MSAGKFNDHPTLVALEFLVRRLIVERCRSDPNPNAALLEWARAIEAEKAEIEKHALVSNMPPEATVNAIEALGEFDRLLGEITGDVAGL